MADLTFTEAALDDLADIWRYTFDTWGADQADAYIRDLERCCAEVATGNATIRAISDTKPGVRFRRCRHHYLFFLMERESVIVIAVLHERLDLLARLEGRDSDDPA